MQSLKIVGLSLAFVFPSHLLWAHSLKKDHIHCTVEEGGEVVILKEEEPQITQSVPSLVVPIEG